MAKFICILFVIVSHLESNTGLLSCFYQNFYLMGFLFVSGYCYKNRNAFSEMIRKKVRQLLIPWFLWGLLSVCFHQLFSGWRRSIHIMGFGDELKWFLFQIRGINDGPWFLAMLFVCFIPFYYLIKAYESSKHPERYKWYVSVLLLVGTVYSACMPPFPYGSNALPWHVEYIPEAMFFLFSGYEYRKLYEGRQKDGKKGFFRAAAGAYLFLCCISQFAVSLPVIRMLLMTVLKVLGVAFLVLLSKKIKPNNYTRFVGQNTLMYFPMHIYVRTLGEPLMRKAFSGIYEGILNNALLSSCFALVFAVVITVILIIPAKIINKYLPFMAGRG